MPYRYLLYLPNFVVLYIKHYRFIRTYWKCLREIPNIINPKNYNEKVLWRKVFDRDPLFVTFSDKIAVKSYVENRLPDLKSAKILWQGSSLEDIPEEVLQQPGYLKINNSSSRNIKLPTPDFSREDLIRMTEKWKLERHGAKWGEWPYALVEPMLFVEEDLAVDGDSQLVDFRVYMCSGTPTLVTLGTGEKTPDSKKAHFTPTGERRPLQTIWPRPSSKRGLLPLGFQTPVDFNEVVEKSRNLSEGVDHVRVDFIWNGKELFAGELTLFSSGGLLRYNDSDVNRAMGEPWDLRDSWFFRSEQHGWRAGYRDALREHLDTKSGASAHR